MVGVDGLERVPVRDGVHQEKALPADHVLLTHSAARSAEKKPKLGRERGVSGMRNNEDVSKAGTLCKLDDHFDAPKLFLASRVQNVHQGIFSVNDTLLPVRV